MSRASGADHPSARAPSTVRARHSVWRGFTAFCGARGLPVSPASARTWLADQLSRGVQPTTLVGYCSHLNVGFHRLGSPDPLPLSDARASLRRLAALDPVQQAPPASLEDVLTAFCRAPTSHGLLASLLWAAAARFSDVTRVLARDVSLGPGDTVEWVYRVTKTDPVAGASRRIRFSLPSIVLNRLRERLLSLPPGSVLFPDVAYGAFLAFCHSLRPPHHPRLSAHSWRRGAVQRILDDPADADPSFPLLSRAEAAAVALTGHRSVETLMRYADRIPRARAQLMTAATRRLWDLP